MIQRLKEIEEELMDKLSPESYEHIKSILLSNSTAHETAVYETGYLDGLQAAIVAASENSNTNSYTIDNDEY
mgnify:CR=1 FL=1